MRLALKINGRVEFWPWDGADPTIPPRYECRPLKGEKKLQSRQKPNTQRTNCNPPQPSPPRQPVGASRLHVWPIAEVRQRAGLFSGASVPIQFGTLWGEERNREREQTWKVGDKTPGWGGGGRRRGWRGDGSAPTTCLIPLSGSWQTIRGAISSVLNQARLGIRLQMSHTSRLTS